MQRISGFLTNSPGKPEGSGKTGEQSKSRPASLEGIEWLFSEFSHLYGARFVRMWEEVEPARMKATWAEALAGFSVREVHQGLAACREKPWPPTLPEFLLLCRPKPDYEAMFREAQHQAGRSRYGADVWESPLLFWAAYRIGTWDMVNLPYEKVRTRWVKIIDELIPQADMLAPVPEKSPALAYVPRQVTEAGISALAECKSILGVR